MNISGRGCFVVRHLRFVDMVVGDDGGIQMGSNWFQLLDADSYGLVADDVGFGVYWCRTEGCRNYYRYSRSRLRPFLAEADYRVVCPH